VEGKVLYVVSVIQDAPCVC